MSLESVTVVSWDAGGGQPLAETAGLLTRGRRLAQAVGARLVWVWLGPLPQDTRDTAARFGADALDQIEGERLTGFGPDAFVAALADYCREAAPELVLFAQDPHTRIVAPRLAERIGLPAVIVPDTESYAANCVARDGRVLCAAGFPRTVVVDSVGVQQTAQHIQVGGFTRTFRPFEGDEFPSTPHLADFLHHQSDWPS